MPAPILPVHLSIPAIAAPITPAANAFGNSGGAFTSALTEAISKVDSFQQNAHESINHFLSGEGEELHQVALSTQQADLSFQLFLQVRNKVVSAYQEVMRMQV